MVELPLPRSGLPALERLLNGDLWARWESAGKVFKVPDFRRSVRYLRLKPGTSCRIAVFRGVDPLVPGRPPTAMLLYLFPSVDRAREFFGKRASSKLWTQGPVHEPFLDARESVVGMPFPCDREIPALRHVYRHHRLKQNLGPFLSGEVPPGWRISKRSTHLRLLRYKVGRRAVFRYETGLRQTATGQTLAKHWHLKVESSRTFSRSRNAFVERLGSALDPRLVSIPEVRGVNAALRITLRKWLRGRDLATRLSDPVAVCRAARALAAFHGASPAGRAPRVDDPIGAAVAEGDALEELLPAEASRIRWIVDRIRDRWERIGAGTVTVHGDFHPEQVLFAGDRVVLIDLDRCGTGHPSLDLGSFLAHAVERQLDTSVRDAFLEAYRDAASHELEPGVLAAAYGLGLLRRCARPFRELERDWPARVRQRLDRLERAAREID